LVCWNCKDYPWKRGPGLGPIAEDRDIICLIETHEHEGCKTPLFEGYWKIVVWNKAIGNGKGHGGSMVLVREKEGCFIQLEKEDPNKQFVWLKISKNGNHIRIVACYFALQVSKIYKSRELDNKDPFAALKTNIAIYSQLGEVLIVGDFNARTAGEQASILCCKEDGDHIWLT
jgi:exonuclease III